MKPVWGLGISGEEQFSLLPSTLPEEFSFLEIPGDILELPGLRTKLSAYPSKFRKALVIRDILPADLVDAAPLFALPLKIDFDLGFRTRCEAAARFGCHFISAEFNLIRAFSDADYRKHLLNLLRSISGILDEFKLIMLLPAAYLLAQSGNVQLVWWAFPIAEIVSFAATILFMIRIYKKIISHIGE